jgi:formylglycine-generating enzyme required for sulfatase activity
MTVKQGGARVVDVFISYKKERRDHAERLAAVLEAHGFDTWWDYGLLVDAGSYDAQIEAKLTAAKAVIVLWCSGARASDFVKDEARHAKNAKKLAAALIEANIEPPVGFGMNEMAFLLSWTGDPDAPGVGRLIDAVERLVDRPRKPARNVLNVLKIAPHLPEVAPMTVAPAVDTNAPPRSPGAAAMPAGPSFEDLKAIWVDLKARASQAHIRAFFDDYAKATPLRFEVEHHLDELDRARAERAARELAEAEARRQAAAAAAEDQRRRIAGAEFRDGEGLPLMVTIPAGTFRMGSPDNEKDRSGDEGPVREVRIPQPLAVGKYPVTVGEFRRFLEATGHDTGASAYVWDGIEWKDTPGRGWRSPGFGQDDNHPVTCVNWHDAVAYAAWIAKVTGKEYRLLSEAEWEYACRAGTQTRYAVGDEISADKANFNRNKNGTTPVGAYPANAFKLHDMHGNVWEWCQDCWNANYNGAPTNGSAWTTGDCSLRVVRGGSWNSDPNGLRSANRHGDTSANRDDDNGFRLARTVFLTP